MSLTYPDTRPEPQPIVPEMRSREAEAYTPVYARRPVRRKGKVKSWMILAPVGALTVAALGAWALMNPGEETAAPAAAEPAPIAAPALTTDPLLTEAATPEDAVLQPPLEATPAPTPAPVASTPRAEPASAPAAREAQAEPAAEPVETIAPPAGPQAYDAVVAAEGGVTTGVDPAEPAPLIVVEPN